jgi:hypothetical protein
MLSDKRDKIVKHKQEKFLIALLLLAFSPVQSEFRGFSYTRLSVVKIKKRK